MGVYYLVGAFMVGIVFASVFAPFYFFVAGTELRREDFSLLSVVLGVAFTVAVVPARLAAVVLHRRAAFRERPMHSLRVAVPMLPTMVFTLVIAGILRDSFLLPQHLFGALIVYTLLNTVVPGLLLRTPTPTFDAPELPEVEPPPKG
jgi:hypothetical protein